jgi:hypothetical protein
MPAANKMSMVDGLLQLVFWFGVLLVVQAGCFFMVRERFPSDWLFVSLGAGIFGLVLLLVVREIQLRRGGSSGRWRDSDAEDIYSPLDD